MAIEYRTEPDRSEFLDGVAHPKVSPRQRHAVVQGKLVRIIATAGEGLGQCGPEWEIRLAQRSKPTRFIPDVAFFSFERLRALAPADRECPPCAPDVTVEVFSLGDSRRYLQQKIALYLTHGALVVLDVDPLDRSIRVFDRERGAVPLLLCAGAVFAHEAVPWLRFNVQEAFADLDIPEKDNGR